MLSIRKKQGVVEHCSTAHIPTRYEIASNTEAHKKVEHALQNKQEILFQPIDLRDINEEKTDIDDNRIMNYAIGIHGVFENSMRALVILTGIKPSVNVLIPLYLVKEPNKFKS